MEEWIKKQRNKLNRTWDWIRCAGKETDEELCTFLRNRQDEDRWPEISVERWVEIVNKLETAERNANQANQVAVTNANNEIGDIKEPQDPDSAWQQYKDRLKSQKFGETTINTIKNSTINILQNLSSNTQDQEPRKGLVVGNVQSGKTANMAALMAMAADYRWNMFIVLSGMIESLRIQTQKRLITDLQHEDPDNQPKYHWDYIENPNSVEIYGKCAENKNFKEDSNQCYLCVCLKQKDRLKNLINWLHYKTLNANNTPVSMMKVLVIDDEADQASINTAKDEDKTAINSLILHLINGEYQDGDLWKKDENPFLAMNYVGYTATPYANVLNETPGVESLYPKDFIYTLPVSDEYFGPQQIFGNDECETKYEGLDIVRVIPRSDIDNGDDTGVIDIKKIHTGVITSIPLSLQNSICWFLCGVACMRVWGKKDPVTMLVHTSIQQEHHKNVAGAINSWIRNTPNDTIIDLCREVWKKETNQFSLDCFHAQYPEYGRLNNPEGLKVTDYPDSFDSIKKEIKKLLDAGTTSIGLDSKLEPKYSNGIHLCIDNCAQTNNGNETVRLIYPEKNTQKTATAFIVVGGQTLSRGLTIEGLVSTFFLRSAVAADTLMQMGRWFGYRGGYELLPRIWMSDRAISQFKFLSDMDQDLRDEIKEMVVSGKSPEYVGPRIMQSPKASLIRIVAANKMQSAVDAEFDFSGHTSETGVFDNDKDKLKSNLEMTARFIQLLEEKKPDNSSHFNAHNKVWRNVPLSMIKGYLQDYQFSKRIKAFSNMTPLIEWLEKVTDEEKIGNWNVILAGTKNEENKIQIGGVSVNMINRTQRYERQDVDDVLNIGILRSPDDFLSDITKDKESLIPTEKSHTLKEIYRIRERAGLSSTPQLVLYVINKDSEPKKNSGRFPLKAKENIAAFSINIPGERSGGIVKKIKIYIPEVDIQEQPQ